MRIFWLSLIPAAFLLAATILLGVWMMFPQCRA